MGTHPIFESDFDCLTAGSDFQDKMSDVSDPEDEIIEFDTPTPAPVVVPQARGDHRGHSHGHAHCRPAQARQHLQKPPGADKWPAVYTTYLNIHRTKAQGRRVPKEFAVNNPTFYEIKDILINEGFQVYLEDKVHPRELDRLAPLGPPPLRNPFRGRVKYRLKDERGMPMTRFKTKDEVLKYIGSMIPKLKTRIEGQRMMDMHIQQQQEEQKLQQAKQAGKKSTGKPQSKKKKNKK